MADNKRFMGRGFSFPFRVDPATNRIAMSSAEQDVEEAIRIILRTNLGERVMLPEFGTSAGDFLFSDDRAERVAALEESVREALEQWEPRITDIEVTADRDGSSKGVLAINIQYTLRVTNNQFNMVYPFYMMEGEGR
ncbi:MAG: baseplate protein [Ruminococcaceae bacterium]|nr:baseplate protein [Oscillospiraceae bacterium]MBD9061447.1 baseplate protein [Oscillospiraceae bacterium]